jgi:hypothetical protein
MCGLCGYELGLQDGRHCASHPRKGRRAKEHREARVHDLGVRLGRDVAVADDEERRERPVERVEVLPFGRERVGGLDLGVRVPAVEPAGGRVRVEQRARREPAARDDVREEHDAEDHLDDADESGVGVGHFLDPFEDGLRLDHSRDLNEPHEP